MELSVKGICKSFGAGNILDGVDFGVKGGEICALLGENGAGKSTLMNIIGGIYAADAGEILIDGQPVHFSGPIESLNAGIAFIHQELDLINDLTVCENLFLSALTKKGLFLDRKGMTEKTREIFGELGIGIDPEALVETLDASYKQMVEIARALLSDASVIIMDEPTSSLSPAEIERVFTIMRTLRKKGIGIIFISHKLNEVMEICDRYTVLRNGKMVSTGAVSDVTVRALASFMVGHDLSIDQVHSPAKYGETVLTLSGLSCGNAFRDVSLSLKRGEILGVTGLLGDGRSALFETVFGIHGNRYEGKIVLNGREIHPASPEEAVKAGLAYLPRNRKENAVIPDMSIIDNGTGATLDRYGQLFFDRAAQKKVFSEQVRDLRIKMSDAEHLITTISGGNQQKAILSRWLLSEPSVLILDNPTQGVDVGAKEEIYGIIEGLAEKGIGVIVLSPEAQEIIRICDRSLVMYQGQVAGEVEGDRMNEQEIMFLAAGAGKDR